VNTGQGVSYTQQQDDYGTLKASYVNAQLAKNLASEQIPREVSVNTLGVDRWDPFELQRHHLKKAILSSDKLHNIQKLISMFILKLPTAVEWEKFAYDNELMSENIRELLLEALCSDVATVPSPVESTLAEFGCALLERSRYLLAKNMRAAKLAKLFGCAIMCIVEHLDGGLKQSAGDVSSSKAICLMKVT
jgi:hypothetical protein